MINEEIVTTIKGFNTSSDFAHYFYNSIFLKDKKTMKQTAETLLSVTNPKSLEASLKSIFAKIINLDLINNEWIPAVDAGPPGTNFLRKADKKDVARFVTLAYRTIMFEFKESPHGFAQDVKHKGLQKVADAFSKQRGAQKLGAFIEANKMNESVMSSIDQSIKNYIKKSFKGAKDIELKKGSKSYGYTFVVNGKEQTVELDKKGDNVLTPYNKNWGSSIELSKFIDLYENDSSLQKGDLVSIDESKLSALDSLKIKKLLEGTKNNKLEIIVLGESSVELAKDRLSVFDGTVRISVDAIVSEAVVQGENLGLRYDIQEFLTKNPVPNDKEMHEFALGLGVTHEKLEEEIYALLADMLSRNPLVDRR